MVLTEQLKSELTQEVITKISELFVKGAVGSDGTLPESSQTALGDEKLRKDIEPVEISGNNIIIPLFISTNEANNETLVEVGYFNNGTMWLRDLFDETLKIDSINLYFDASIDVEVEEIE